MISVGDSFLQRGTGPNHDSARPHIFIILKDDATRGDLYVVPMCTWSHGCDGACILEPNCGWPPVQRKSFIAYYHGARVGKAGITSMIGRTVSVIAKPSASVFQSVIAGLRQTTEVEAWFKDAVLAPSARRILPSL